MIYFNEPFLTIHWDETALCVIMEWKSFASSADFRRGLEKGLELLASRHTGRWLADLRKMGTISVEDQNWSNNNWFPRAVGKGLRHMAMVMPQSALAAMGVRNIMSQLNEITIETHYFDNIDAAKEWLKSIK